MEKSKETVIGKLKLVIKTMRSDYDNWDEIKKDVSSKLEPLIALISDMIFKDNLDKSFVNKMNSFLNYNEVMTQVRNLERRVKDDLSSKNQKL